MFTFWMKEFPGLKTTPVESFLYSLPVAVFRLSSGRRGNNTDAHTMNLSSSLTLFSTYFSLPWQPPSFLPSVDDVDTATGVFPSELQLQLTKAYYSPHIHIILFWLCFCVCVWVLPQLFSACSRDFHAVGPRHSPKGRLCVWKRACTQSSPCRCLLHWLGPSLPQIKV